MSDITLSASVRQNLLSLQSTTQLIGRTQNRLSTGLRVASPIDDPVSFFQAKGLTDRATDFSEKKDNIDQGVSSLTAATDAVTAVESLVQQLKGLATNAKSSTTTTQIDNIASQFNDLRAQIDNLVNDASYQGLNLVAGTGSTLTVNFSNDTASILNVKSVDIRAGGTGLDVSVLSRGTEGINFNRSAISAGTVTAGGSIAVTIGGQSANTLTVGDTFTLTYGTQTFAVTISSTATATTTNFLSQGTYSVGDTISFTIASAALSTGPTKLLNIGAASVSVSEGAGVRQVGVGYATDLSNAITNLDSALTTLRSRSQTLGSNVALLQTRLDFTKNYVNTLTSGSGKLTLADLNQEGGNLLALQTRQQLGIQALSFAGKSEQAILGLFR
ncbi:flagellin [Varunaivibrio sulfuroxidans]|uniref:Flagellin n=1 Tax=Varunaivibrio sulfuroxidans TaxID=1773489 RepID=A0A4R3JAT6_9PROT|nr:flagellin [Varunaivibrio sulfuroxidans]TCS62988.1 flagellin-like hook-associated protein FlgL [Varunaivibrio sulfuroxidans]WES31934.1 flagellin [Varunaivibrio sulfuroxidans]